MLTLFAVAMLDEIAWLFNLRGSEYGFPYLLTVMLAGTQELTWSQYPVQSRVLQLCTRYANDCGALCGRG